MDNEIKEILNKFDKVLENYELDKKFGQMSVDSICHLFPNEMTIIKDCITNLQEENEELKGMFGIWNNRKLIKKFNKEYDKEDKRKNPNREYVVTYPDAEEVYKRYYDYKSRNEKAIEYLEYQISQLDFYEDTKAKMLGSMALVLLQGSDNNDN